MSLRAVGIALVLAGCGSKSPPPSAPADAVTTSGSAIAPPDATAASSDVPAPAPDSARAAAELVIGKLAEKQHVATRVFAVPRAAGATSDTVIVLGVERGRDNAFEDLDHDVPDRPVDWVVPMVDIVSVEAGAVVAWTTVREEGVRNLLLAEAGSDPLAPKLELPTQPPEIVAGPGSVADRDALAAKYRGALAALPDGQALDGLYRGSAVILRHAWSVGAWVIVEAAIQTDESAESEHNLPFVDLVRMRDGAIAETIRVGAEPRVRDGVVVRHADSKRIAYTLAYDGEVSFGMSGLFGASDVIVADADGAHPRRVSTSRLGSDPRWLSDGRLVYAEDVHVMIADGDGSHARALQIGKRVRSPQGEYDYDHCHFWSVSPDLRFVASNCESGGRGSVIVIGSVANADAHAGVSVVDGPLGVEWRAKDVKVTWTKEEIEQHAETISYAKLEALEKKSLLAPPLPEGVIWLEDLQVAKDGRVLATGRHAFAPLYGDVRDPLPASDVYLREAGAPWIALSTSHDAAFARWSPDGKRVAWTITGEVVIATPGSDERTSVSMAEDQRKPLFGLLWSPDGSLLASLTDDSEPTWLVFDPAAGRVKVGASFFRSSGSDFDLRFVAKGLETPGEDGPRLVPFAELRAPPAP